MTSREGMDGVRVFSAASRYVQGPGALDAIGEELARVGVRALVLVDAFLAESLGPRIAAACSAAGVATTVEAVAAEVTPATFARYAELAVAAGASVAPSTAVGSAPGVAPAASVDVVVGVGGGKTIDIAKGVARLLEVEVATVPTIASNDSPASRAIAVYDDDHQLREVPQLPRNPALVLVDTTVIAGAPPRFLAAGIGDALSKHAEVEACRAAGGRTMQGTPGLQIAAVLAAGCYDILRRSSATALAELTSGAPGQAFEDTVEAVILLSGMAFENGGLSLAHAATRGLMALPGVSTRLHGEHVAYGLLFQRAHEGAPDAELLDLAAFLASLGLPRTLAELGLPTTHLDPAGVPTADALADLVTGTLTAPHTANAPQPAGAPELTAALLRVEHLLA